MENAMTDFSVEWLAKKWCPVRNAHDPEEEIDVCMCRRLAAAVTEALDRVAHVVEERGKDHVRSREDLIAWIAAAIRALKRTP